jgi:glutamyl/glutaminyl-tRNA synthetase
MVEEQSTPFNSD